jgi:hypothetical protein
MNLITEYTCYMVCSEWKVNLHILIKIYADLSDLAV